MKFHIIPIVNFQKKANLSHEIIKKNLHPYFLINQDVLFENLLKDVSFNVNLSQCRREFQAYQLSASLYFDDSKFRKRYLNWIYSHYSNSSVNHQRVHRSEAAALIKGIKLFNKHNQSLKFVQITPDVDDAHLWAELRLSGMTLTNRTLSFKIENVMEDEYHLNKTEALYQFEKQVGQYLVDAFQDYFKKCIPYFPFSFSQAYLDIDCMSSLKPVKSPKLSNYKDNQNMSSADLKKNKSASARLSLTESSKLSSSVRSKNSYGVLSGTVRSLSASASSLSSSVSVSSLLKSTSSNVLEKSFSASSMEWSSANDLVGLFKVVAEDVSDEDKNEHKNKAASSSALTSNNKEFNSSSDRNATADVSSSSNTEVSLHHTMAQSNKQSLSVNDSQEVSGPKSFGHAQAEKENQIKSLSRASELQIANSLKAEVSRSSQSDHTYKRSSTNNDYSSAISILAHSVSSASSEDNKSKLNSSANSSVVSSLIANSEVNSNHQHSNHNVLWTTLIIIAFIIIVAIIFASLKL